jgi:hypothetical protein
MPPLERRTKFIRGLLLALLPIVFSIVLPVAFFRRIAVFLHTDGRLVEDYAFMLGAISE